MNTCSASINFHPICCFYVPKHLEHRKEVILIWFPTVFHKSHQMHDAHIFSKMNWCSSDTVRNMANCIMNTLKCLQSQNSGQVPILITVSLTAHLLHRPSRNINSQKTPTIWKVFYLNGQKTNFAWMLALTTLPLRASKCHRYKTQKHLLHFGVWVGLGESSEVVRL